MMKDHFSICIVAFRNYPEVLNAIKSIEKYTAPSIKKTIYVVDNSAFEGENEKFQNALIQFSDVEYIACAKNQGFGKANNIVIKNINSQYHAIINPDIVFIEDSLSKLAGFLDSNANVGMCIPKLIDTSGKRQDAYRKEPTVLDMFVRMFCKKLFPRRMRNHSLQDEDYKKVFQVPFGQGSFLVIRTNLFKELHGFDDRYFMYLEDADLCKRVNCVSRLVYFPETTVIHKWSKGSHRNIRLFMMHLRSMYLYFNKWGWKWK